MFDILQVAVGAATVLMGYCAIAQSMDRTTIEDDDYPFAFDLAEHFAVMADMPTRWSYVHPIYEAGLARYRRYANIN